MAAPAPTFSDLFGDATQWDEPVPDYDALILLLGGVAGTTTGAAVYDRATTMTALANLAHRSPTLVAFWISSLTSAMRCNSPPQSIQPKRRKSETESSDSGQNSAVTSTSTHPCGKWWAMKRKSAPLGGVAEQVGERRGRSRHVGRALERRVLGTINFPLLRLRYFIFDGEQNYEIDFLQVLAFQLLDFSGFVCCLY